MNPPTVRVAFGALALLVGAGAGTACKDGGPTLGTLQVSIATTGADLDLDADGYVLTVDNESPRTVNPVGVVRLDNVATGSHTISLSGFAANCAVLDGDSRTVTVREGAVAEVTFMAACAANVGSLQVTTVTTGPDVDGDGYRLYFADTGLDVAFDVNDTVRIPGIRSGEHLVRLDGLAPNCSVTGANPRTVSASGVPPFASSTDRLP